MKRFIPFDPDQPLLLPPDLRDALPAEHPALLLVDLVEDLDFSEIYDALPDERWGGKPGFDPRMMSLVWIYAYMLGMRSSRKVAKALVENIAFRMLANNQTPGHWALNNFRTRHREALGNLLNQTVSVAAGLGLVKLESVAIDGTKIKAYASKSKAMSYGRMDAREEALKREIDAYLDAVDEQDALEDEQFGVDGDGMSLPEGLRDARARREKIAQAKKELEERAVERKRKEQEKRRRAAEREGREYQPRDAAEDATPKDSDQVNFTDPESRIMKSDGAFVQAYNAQAAVDTDSQVVLAAGVSNQAADVEHLQGMTHETMAATGRTPKQVLADAGYHSQENVEQVEALGIEPFIPPDKIRHAEWRAQQAPKGRIPKALSPEDRMRRKLATKEGKRQYQKRQTSVEPVFGQTKECRGLRQFLHRGLEKNHHLFRFDMAVHNIWKIIRQIQRCFAPPTGARKSRMSPKNALATPA